MTGKMISPMQSDKRKILVHTSDRADEGTPTFRTGELCNRGFESYLGCELLSTTTLYGLLIDIMPLIWESCFGLTPMKNTCWLV
jgi:hypothetical protein